MSASFMVTNVPIRDWNSQGTPFFFYSSSYECSYKGLKLWCVRWYGYVRRYECSYKGLKLYMLACSHYTNVTNVPIRDWNTHWRSRCMWKHRVTNVPIRDWNLLHILTNHFRMVTNVPIRDWNRLVSQTAAIYLVTNVPIRDWNFPSSAHIFYCFCYECSYKGLKRSIPAVAAECSVTNVPIRDWNHIVVISTFGQ